MSGHSHAGGRGPAREREPEVGRRGYYWQGALHVCLPTLGWVGALEQDQNALTHQGCANFARPDRPPG